MGIFILQEHLADNESHWIERCKSSSMETGYRLRQAHYALGVHMGSAIYTTNPNQSKFAVWILMRAGLPFGLGIADGLEEQGCDVAVYFIDKQIDNDTLASVNTRTIILADAVINSGKSIERICTILPEIVKQSMIVATTVMPSNAVSQFEHFNLMTVRVSSNQYQGAKVNTIQNGKGPDTGDRLFNTL
ncbi:uracil phosphoribosyltransferase [Actinobacillus equuli]|uniref:Phosphoribosyltransferase domain-containing protein n=1 Tax=Actinobacillus equuli TaxID=718 RepID=A0AAX3FLH6_ACTEU|nr:uracil phosphoribosyltransferase [Actinobacillus equuli]AIZ79738.1 hypothetical protein ACEE_08140 [Actinobacillus equuli subsp. equuli]MDG4952975.1 uracil phosphoribosyltransferase [Actinobacillus equuli subsp. equuli]WGE43848.1 uracil phosphoribosyltransferase [Actinobacillus equuli subsp. equuli]WGE48101.1 uracil phosphoribosyltransferase [Actinobacillus equuli subsp. equuli]VEE90552.1 Uncharacterised protein [Actinobacillus equuli]